MCACHSVLECYVMFSGVKLSIRSFNLFALCKSVLRLHLLYVVFKLCALKVKCLENFRAFAF